MFSKLKQPITILLMVLICFQILQLLYRKRLWEIKQSIRGQSVGTVNAKDVIGSGQEKMAQGFGDKSIRINKKGDDERNKQKKSISTATSTTALTSKPADSKPNSKNNVRISEDTRQEKAPVTSSAQANVLKVIRAWRERQAEREKLQKLEPIRYDAHNLLDDPKIEFNTNFKNPCWFEGENLRCLPYVLVIGVKKCGTSDLFYRLSLHPEFVRPGFKEAQFFASKRFKAGGGYDDINVYIDMFSSAAYTILNRSSLTPSGELSNYRYITGEGSPSNLHLNTHWRHLPGNENLDEPKYVILDYIQHFLPDVKIIITFRDPVERLYSDYYHEYGSLMKLNHPNPRQFHQVVTEGIAMYKDCFRRHSVRSCVYESSIYDKTKIQIQLGIYYIFWQDLTRLFPRNQILVLQNKNLRDKETTMKTVYEFLKLQTLSKTEMKLVVNKTETYTRKESFKKEGPMLNETARFLKEFYEPFNKLMAEMTGDKEFLYNQKNSAG